MMPSRLTTDRKIQLALKFYPSHATYSGQASWELRITRLSASVSSESGDQGNLLCNQHATLGGLYMFHLFHSCTSVSIYPNSITSCFLSYRSLIKPWMNGGVI